MASQKYANFAFPDKRSKAGTIRTLKSIFDLLSRPNGWIKGDYHERVGSTTAYCLIGAAQKIDGLNEQRAKVLMYLALPRDGNTVVRGIKLFRRIIFWGYDYMGVDPTPSIVAFNDRKTTRKSSVLALVKRAIRIAESIHVTP